MTKLQSRGGQFMFAMLKRHFRRRVLGPVAGALPAMLKHRFGAQDAYVPAQVGRVADKLKLSAEQRAFAFAACRAEGDFLAAAASKTPADYRLLRAELAALFDIWPPEFTCKHLRGMARNSRWEPMARQDGTGMDGGGH